MGELRRPTTGWALGLRHDNELVAVGSADTLIGPRLAGLTRREAVELSRLCAARPDLYEVALRLWHSFVFPALARERDYRWAVSNRDAELHPGNRYRFDGWVRLGRLGSGVDPRTGRDRRNKVILGWPARPASRLNRHSPSRRSRPMNS